MKTILFVLSFSLLVAGCAQPGVSETGQLAESAETTPPTVDKAASRDQVTLRLDWFYSSSHAPFFLGIEKGWYRDAGIDLTLTEGKGSGSVVQLVGNGTDTFGYATSDTVIRGVQSGIPVRNVANIMPRTTDAIMVLKSSSITSPDELRGKSIAVIAGSAAEVLLPEFLAGAGLSLNDVTVVTIDPALKIQALLNGLVDSETQPAWASSYFEPAGGVNVFRYSDYGIVIVGYGLVTNTATIENDPSLVTRFVNATLKAWHYSAEHPEEALKALQRESAEHARPEAVERDTHDLPLVLELAKPAAPGMPLGFNSAPDWEAMQDLLIEYGIIDESRAVSDYMTNDFVTVE
ncbi:ABC transporter substrate-binding protein [Chloroflexota bacterium]